MNLSLCVLFLLPLIEAQRVDASQGRYNVLGGYGNQRGFVGPYGYPGSIGSYDALGNSIGSQGNRGYGGYGGYVGYGGSGSFAGNGYISNSDINGAEIIVNGNDFKMYNSDEEIEISGPNGQKMYNELLAAISANGGKLDRNLRSILAAYEVKLFCDTIILTSPGSRVFASYKNNNKVKTTCNQSQFDSLYPDFECKGSSCGFTSQTSSGQNSADSNSNSDFSVDIDSNGVNIIGQSSGDYSSDSNGVEITVSGNDYVMKSPNEEIITSGPNGQKMYNELKAAMAANGGRLGPNVRNSLSAYQVTMSDNDIVMSGPGGTVVASFNKNKAKTSSSGSSGTKKIKTINTPKAS